MKTDEPKSNDILLSMQGIVKDFGGTRALDHVALDVRRGEVHALIGENGAGKSTLVNVLAGRFGDYAGTIIFDGRHVRITNPRQGRQMGIAVIFQDLNVLPNFTVAENIMLGDELAARWSRKINRSSLNAEARRVIDHLRFDLHPDESVARLSRARQCMVEIAGAVRRNVKLLVFDEPTACLGSEDVAKLFAVIEELKKRGLAIVYISHRITELPRIADRVTVLRDAKVVGTRDIAECKVSELTRMILGHDLAEFFPEKTNRPGEVVLEIARAVFGADKASGTVSFCGRPISNRSPSLSKRLGIAMVPENRKVEGNITGRSVCENLNITILDRLAGALGFQSPRKLAVRAESTIQRMRIEPPRPKTNIQNLSGGNQQKVIVGRWLAADSKVIIFDEPTQGIDVGTKAQIYKLVTELACKGKAIILISSELLEIAKLADRILVIRTGRIVREVSGSKTNEDRLFAECTGGGKTE
ncbi:MAG: sugar ABC transporter ATP-binding protein [Planctomycetota bacterium]